jgi:SAM-dependent methyltransferase
MKWTENEIALLAPVLERFEMDLMPLDGKNILVLCSAGGDVAFWLARRMKQGKVTGIELGSQLLEHSRRQVKEQGLENIIEFHHAEKTRIPFPDSTFDALVSEFIVFPTPSPTEIGQPEMARVLKSGGIMALTDVIVVKPLPEDVRTEFREIGLEYLCEGTQDDFLRWMEEAGLVEAEVMDLTPVVRQVWEKRQSISRPKEPKGFTYLLDDPNFRLGDAIFYIYARGKKP